MTNFENTVKEILSDLSDSGNFSKENFLSLLVKNRIEDQTQTYNKEFDKVISSFIKEDLNSKDLSLSLRRLSFISETLVRSYDELIKDFENFQRYLNNFNSRTN